MALEESLSDDRRLLKLESALQLHNLHGVQQTCEVRDFLLVSCCACCLGVSTSASASTSDSELRGPTNRREDLVALSCGPRATDVYAVRSGTGNPTGRE